MVRDIPLNEITLRKYEKPYDAPKREIARKVCLTLGLLQPGDSRDIIVDILLVLDEARKQKVMLSSFEIGSKVEILRKQSSLEIKGLAESNIRRQLKRLRDAMIAEKLENKYRLSEFLPISEIFTTKIEKFLVPQIIERAKDYLNKLDSMQ